MKKIFYLLVNLMLVASLASCIKDEAPNAECDITGVSFGSPDILNRAPVISNERVLIMVNTNVNVTALAPIFTLTPGATIQPENGTVRNFTTPQEYVVTSEDGEWHKTYVVDVQRPGSINLKYDFEHVRQVSALSGAASYDVFYEVGSDGKESLTWASANAAFALTLQGSTPNTFPTYQAIDGERGKCLALTTRSTGTFGQTVKKPLAAGNLFLGEFAMANALAKPLEATHFGTTFLSVPLAISGLYKYFPGKEYCKMGSDGKLTPVDGVTDKFNIYAVFFEVTADMQWLDGTNVLAADNPNIIAVAEIENADPASVWTEFNIPFIFRDGKEVDPELLAAGRYSISIVMTSSREGDYFEGAIGSSLFVDDLVLLCE